MTNQLKYYDTNLYGTMMLLETAHNVTGHSIPAKVKARHSGDPSQLIVFSEKAKTALGWKPKFTDINSIIETAWNWHSSHPNGYN